MTWPIIILAVFVAALAILEGWGAWELRRTRIRLDKRIDEIRDGLNNRVEAMENKCIDCNIFATKADLAELAGKIAQPPVATLKPRRKRK